MGDTVEEAMDAMDAMDAMGQAFPLGYALD
jgi:hypothetical protein